MMESKFPGAHARALALLAILLAALLVGLFVSELSFRYRWAHETLENLEPRYARFAGLLQAGATIQKREEQTYRSLLRVAHPATVEVSRIGTDLQQRMRLVAADHELQVNGSQILPVREQEGFLSVSVSGSMEGSIGAVSAFLLQLQAEEPPVFVEKLVIHTPRNVRLGASSDGQIAAQVTLSVLRLLP